MVNKIVFFLHEKGIACIEQDMYMKSLCVICENLKKYIEVCVRVRFDKPN